MYYGVICRQNPAELLSCIKLSPWIVQYTCSDFNGETSPFAFVKTVRGKQYLPLIVGPQSWNEFYPDGSGYFLTVIVLQSHQRVSQVYRRLLRLNFAAPLEWQMAVGHVL